MTEPLTPPPPPPPGPPPPPAPPSATPGGYPATLTVATPERVANWRPLVQWLLAIPHFVVTYVLNLVAEVCAVISWFAIVITGRQPEGLANVIAMALRYNVRTVAYAGFLHAEYPPFDFAATASDPGGHPVRVDFVPDRGARNRLTVGLRFLWVIPAAIVTAIIGIVAAVCWLIAWFAVLFTGRWPSGLHGWVLKGLRAQVRLNAYAFLLTDEYPPLSFD